MQTIDSSYSSALTMRRTTAIPPDTSFQQSTYFNHGQIQDFSTPVTITPLPATYRPHLNLVKFGFACGICPICLGSMAFAQQVDKIKALRDQADSQDVSIKTGQSAHAIRKAGTRAGGDVGIKYIGNEDGTRVQRLSSADYNAFAMAALPRAYETPDSENYQVVGRLQHPSKGVENGLFKQLVNGLQQHDPTESYSNEVKPHLQGEQLNGLGTQARAWGLYHHVAEGPKVRATGRTAPGMVGYASAIKLREHELLVPSIRELPGFESLGAAPGGLMNMLGMAALHGGFNTVYVVVEPWQHELKGYLKVLQNEHQVSAQPLSPHDVPHEYRDFITDLNLSPETQLYKVSLDKIKENLKDIPEDEEKGERDTQLMESIKLPDPEKDLVDKKLKEAVQALPIFRKITLQESHKPNGYKDLKERHPEPPPPYTPKAPLPPVLTLESHG